MFKTLQTAPLRTAEKMLASQLISMLVCKNPLNGNKGNIGCIEMTTEIT